MQAVVDAPGFFEFVGAKMGAKPDMLFFAFYCQPARAARPRDCLYSVHVCTTKHGARAQLHLHSNELHLHPNELHLHPNELHLHLDERMVSRPWSLVLHTWRCRGALRGAHADC